jgi:Raf kinase inhibitor-like YbhB/YbcL family protein
LLRELAVAALLMSAVACSGGEQGSGSPPISPIPSNLAGFALSSPAFADGEPIPAEFTCDGADVSPPIQWTSVPDGALELVLTLQDPDAPSGVFTHWTVFGIDPATDGSPSGGVPAGALEGTNEFGDAGYGGPCPPEGESHRYFFTLAALSERSELEAGASSSEVDAAVQGATATTTLVGTYPG